MQAVGFKAWCPYEIGDKVKFDICGIQKAMTVTDIITLMRAKTGGVRFVLELDNGARMVPVKQETRQQ